MNGSLFRKYAAVLMLLVGIALLAGGLLEAVFDYRETRSLVDERLALEARAAAARIEQYFRGIESQVREVALLPWSSGVLDLRDRRDEYRRLLKRVPAIAELRAIDTRGIERVRASRVDIDEVGGTRDANGEAYGAARRDGVYYSPTYFKEGSEPYVTLALREPGREGWVTMAEINLKFVGDVIGEIHFGERGRALVVDRANQLVAHPDLAHVLRRTDLGALPQVRALRAAEKEGTPQVGSMEGENVDHVPVLTTFAPVNIAGWWLFAEQPVAEALAPVYASIERTAAMSLAGILLALGASYFLARRLAQPILAVQRGASRIAGGDLDTRIEVRTGDEVESLASEFNHMAAQLQEVYAGLERKVREKTAELEDANRHKSEFLANMSHELRTPLNAIIGFSEVLNERIFGPLNAKQAEYVRDIYGSGQHLLSLINDILDLTKVEAGHMELDAREFPVRAAIHNCCTLIRERALRKRLRLESHVFEDVGNWRADERKFKQVVLNLLSNAVKFTPSGGEVRIVVRVEGDTLVVAVSDSGVGVAPEDQERIFQSFQQVASDEEVRREGSGLGLALSRRLVERHGGTLVVASTPG
ncbi:MAG: sensor histidine kinase, partial [Bacillota bacterium]